MRGEIHKLTLWRTQGFDRGGIPTFSEPVVLSCRWEDESKMYTDSNGNYITAKSVIYFRKDHGIKEGDYVCKGIETSLTPTPLAMDVKQSRTIDSYSGRRTEHRVIL